jgi:DNA-binding response OmpR family regulator
MDDKKKILIVDDSGSIRSLIQTMLEDQDFENDYAAEASVKPIRNLKNKHTIWLLKI